MGFFSDIGSAFVKGETEAFNFVVKESHKFEDWSKGFDKRSHGFSNLIPFYGAVKAFANIETSIDDQSKGKISTGRMLLNFGEDVGLGTFSTFTGLAGIGALAQAGKMSAEAGVQGLSNLATKTTASQVGRRLASQGAEAVAQDVGSQLRESAQKEGLRFRQTQGINQLGEISEQPVDKGNIFKRMGSDIKSKFVRADTPSEKIQKLLKRLPKPKIEPKVETEMNTVEQTYNELPDTFKEIFERNIKTKSNRSKLGMDGRLGKWEEEPLNKASKFEDNTPFHDIEYRDVNDARNQGLIAREDTFQQFKKDLKKSEEKQKQMIDDIDDIDWDSFDLSDDFEEHTSKIKNKNWREATLDKRSPLQKINRFSTADEIRQASENVYNPQEDLDRAYRYLDDLPSQKLSEKIRDAGGFKFAGNIVSII